MGYDLIPKKKGVDCKSGMIFTWPVILNETGACYLFGYGDHTFSLGKYIYDGSRKDGSPVSNDGFEVLGEKAEPPAEEFLQKVENLAEFCEQSEGFNIW